MLLWCKFWAGRKLVCFRESCISINLACMTCMHKPLKAQLQVYRLCITTVLEWLCATLVRLQDNITTTHTKVLSYDTVCSSSLVAPSPHAPFTCAKCAYLSLSADALGKGCWASQTWIQQAASSSESHAEGLSPPVRHRSTPQPAARVFERRSTAVLVDLYCTV